MASTILGNPIASGPQVIISGNPFSGTVVPIGGVQLWLDSTASGAAYIGFSGNLTLTSGGMFLSGGGVNDGMKLTPNTGYFIPKMEFISGQLNVFAWVDVAGSGQARLWWERF